MDESLEELGRNSFRIIQPVKGFRLGMDSVLLADFARVKRGERVVDLCAGCGAISLMLAAREENCRIEAVEIDACMAEMARRNAKLNGIEDRMRVHEGDVRDSPKMLGYSIYTLVVCNPPYFRGEGARARHLGELRLEDIAAAAAAVLRPGGRACFTFPAADVLELTCALKKCALEPKRMRCAAFAADRPPKIILVEAMKNAAPGVHWLPMLITDSSNEEMRRIYNS